MNEGMVGGEREEGKLRLLAHVTNLLLLMDDGIVVRNLLSGRVESTRIAAMQIIV